MRTPDEPASKTPEGKDASDRKTVDPVDEAGVESFPASDPPAWIPLHPGKPAPARKPRDGGRAGPTPPTRT